MKYIYSVVWCILILATIANSQNNDSTSASSENTIVGQPKIKYQPKLVFPEMAREAGMEASIYIKLAIDKNGKPYKTIISKRDPEFVYMFDAEVRRWAMQYEFYPGLNVKGEPIPFWVTFPVRFKLNNFQSPVISDQQNPEYPKEALEMGLEGWVGLAVLIDKNGMRDGRPLVVSREPTTTKVFDDAAIDVAVNSKYLPAKVDGVNTIGWVFMKVEFNIPAR